jgi:hypothetical protein
LQLVSKGHDQLWPAAATLGWLLLATGQLWLAGSLLDAVGSWQVVAADVWKASQLQRRRTGSHAKEKARRGLPAKQNPQHKGRAQMINGVVVRLSSGKVVGMVIRTVNTKEGGTEAGLRQDCDKEES